MRGKEHAPYALVDIVTTARVSNFFHQVITFLQVIRYASDARAVNYVQQGIGRCDRSRYAFALSTPM